MIGVLYPYVTCAYAVWARLMLTKVGRCAQNFGGIKQWLRHAAKKSAVFCLWHCAPERLCDVYGMAAGQPKKHRAVIAQFGRHPHRIAILGRVSTPVEEAYLAAGVFPYQTNLKKAEKGEA